MTDAANLADPVPARPSATIMLIRDGAAGIEVFMVVRDRPMDGAMGARFLQDVKRLLEEPLRLLV